VSLACPTSSDVLTCAQRSEELLSSRLEAIYKMMSKGLACWRTRRVCMYMQIKVDTQINWSPLCDIVILKFPHVSRCLVTNLTASVWLLCFDWKTHQCKFQLPSVTHIQKHMYVCGIVGRHPLRQRKVLTNIHSYTRVLASDFTLQIINDVILHKHTHTQSTG